MFLAKMRRTFVEALNKLAEKDTRIQLLTADIGFGVLEPFAKKYPDRFLNVGIGEQNGVGIATGLALKGKIPFVYTINSFLVFRAFEQIRMLSYMGKEEPLHVILVGTGLSNEYTNQGISHYAYGDKTCLETLPIKILTPVDKEDLLNKLNEAYSNPGVYYLRLTRFDKLRNEYKDDTQIFIHRDCPLCKRKDANILYKRNYEVKEIQENLFSARRERKKKTYEHNTFLKCKNCGLVYANPIIESSVVNQLYKESKYNYGDQEEDMKNSYGRFLKDIEKFIKNKGRILDIGTGNGFFLLEALNQGYTEAWGIEPSKHAVELANKKIRERIILDILKEDQFKEESFDVITLFQVIDHLEDPNLVLKICNKYLKKRGAILCISHDVSSLSSKLFGEKSPVFDIEHTQLFSKKTIEKILNRNGFKVIQFKNIQSTFTLEYWIRMSPLPKKLKEFIKKILGNLNSKKITIKPGNFGVIAIKI
jgi:2-polyprenyl-3-methyl-5-hydroxy-6-metoxy-1,4-benzoquinol methylase